MDCSALSRNFVQSSRDRDTSPLPKCFFGNFYHYGCLTSLVLISLNKTNNMSDSFGIISLCNDILNRKTINKVRSKYAIQNLIGGKRILIFLIKAQFGRRRLSQNMLGNEIISCLLVDITTQSEDLCF